VEGAHYDPAKALAALDAITKEPFDSFVATAALAEAALKLTQGQSSEAEALMGKTLDSWVTTQRDLNRQPPVSSIDADVAEIRQVVFRPLGDLPIYGGSGWNAFNFPATLPRFIVVRADVQVKTSDGEVGRHTVYQRFPDLDHVLLLKSDELSLLARLLPTIGGTKQPRADPSHGNAESASRRFDANPFAIRAVLRGETRPLGRLGTRDVSAGDPNRIRQRRADQSECHVTIGYSGATVVLEKVDGKWRAVRLTNQWITKHQITDL
jgi:hypothetical protein